ncbi:MAG: tetratricopeptide repeat protein [Bacteroidales bacterium]|nr:tetratricopeptide repeat protein [Bacteroidales bacterium]
MFFKKSLYILLFFVFLAFQNLFAQERDKTQRQDYLLANEYFAEGKTEEGINIMEDLISKDFNDEYYKTLLAAYKQTEDLKKREKLIKTALKKRKSYFVYLIDYGLFYLDNNDSVKADKMFTQAVNSLAANSSDVHKCASIFTNNRLYDYTCKTYIKGRELLKNKTLYTYELGYIYQMQGKNEHIINEYLLLVEDNPKMINQAVININNLLERDKGGHLLENLHSVLLSKVKQQPKNEQLSRLYLWTLVKEGNYSSALVQVKAINKRFDDNSCSSIFQFGQTAMSAKKYETAKQAFDYIIEQKEENVYYDRSVINRMRCLYLPYKEKISHSEKENRQMKSEFEKVFSSLGQNSVTADLMHEYALFLAYSLHSSQDAVDVLDTLINMHSLPAKQRALAKIDRGDIYLMEDDVWAASLEYSQVDKDFKNENEGALAKFKNALLSYYTGEFEWALSQFSTLRASTSKLIANDAMEYSLLIKENMDLDSSYNALSYFAKADFLLYQNKYEQAKETLAIIENAYLSHPIFDEILFKKGQIAYKEKDYQTADSLWQNLLLKYGYDLMADDALWSLAQMQEYVFLNKEKALEYYQRIILDYPSSLYVPQARKKNEELLKQN